MADTLEHNYPLLMNHFEAAAIRYTAAGWPEETRDCLRGFASEFIKRLAQLVSDAGGDPDYITHDANIFSDALTNAFQDAIDKRDQRIEAARDPMDNAMSRADLRRDQMNERETA
jgi:hypothetical protein